MLFRSLARFDQVKASKTTIRGAFSAEQSFNEGNPGEVHFSGDRATWPYVYRKLYTSFFYIRQNEVVFD